MNRKTETKIAGFLRAVVVAVLFIMQIMLILLLVYGLRQNAIYLYALIEIIAVIEVIMLLSYNKNTSYKIAWVMIIVILPVFGQILYALWGRSGTNSKSSLMLKKSIEKGEEYMPDSTPIYNELVEKYPERKRIARYLDKMKFSIYKNTDCKYFKLGELQFDAMIKDMENAEKFIFIEYFILNDGMLWDRIHDVLRKKAAEGVEVRLMFDDLGSLITAPDNLVRKLKEEKIEAVRFNPIHKYISRLYLNYRNHQKIVVIDGNIGYTGGTNLSDEYTNEIVKHGHWKDTAIRLYGDAVWSLTITFLSMWDAQNGSESFYDKYRPTITTNGEGFFQPFADGPVNNPDNPAEKMYFSMINGAKEYLYITTPYLAVDGQMIDALCTAALSGTDVRIIVPKIWDHWYVHMVTQSNYGELIKAGVKIYEYTPGYIHAKMVVSDDDHAIIGTINMEYRSFYLNFENAVWIYKDDVVGVMKNDILETIEKSEEIKYEDWERRPWHVKLIQTFLRMFALIF